MKYNFEGQNKQHYCNINVALFLKHRLLSIVTVIAADIRTDFRKQYSRYCKIHRLKSK